MRRVSILLRSESSHRGDDVCELHCVNILHIIYVEYFVMYICIYVYSLKRNYVGFDPE